MYILGLVVLVSELFVFFLLMFEWLIQQFFLPSAIFQIHDYHTEGCPSFLDFGMINSLLSIIEVWSIKSTDSSDVFPLDL